MGSNLAIQQRLYYIDNTTRPLRIEFSGVVFVSLPEETQNKIFFNKNEINKNKFFYPNSFDSLKDLIYNLANILFYITT